MTSNDLSNTSASGKPIYPTPEGVANFWKWFKQSKVVDVYGRPLIAYHGTYSNIDAFKAGRDGGALGVGMYFTPSSSFANTYAEVTSDWKDTEHAPPGNVVPVFLSVQNPLELSCTLSKDPMVEALIKLGVPETKARRIVEKAYDEKGYITTEVKSRAIKAGYDGIIRYINGEITEIVVYFPSQIKSAVGNNGNFNPYSQKITETITATKKPVGRPDNHLEDLLIINGHQGGLQALQDAQRVQQYPTITSIKWDGTAAIYFGRDDNGTFYLAPKAQWNKGKKLSKTELANDVLTTGRKFAHQTPDQHLEDRKRLVAQYERLWDLLEAATPLAYRGFVQGDLMFIGKQTLNEKNEYTFLANKVTYTVKKNGLFGKMMVASAFVTLHRFHQEFGLSGDGVPVNEDHGNIFNKSRAVIALGLQHPEIAIESLTGLETTRAFIEKHAKKIDAISGYTSDTLKDIKKVLYSYACARAVKNGHLDFADWLNLNDKIAEKKKVAIRKMIADFTDEWNVFWKAFNMVQKVNHTLFNKLNKASNREMWAKYGIRAVVQGEVGGEGFMTPNGKIINPLFRSAETNPKFRGFVVESTHLPSKTAYQLAVEFEDTGPEEVLANQYDWTYKTISLKEMLRAIPNWREIEKNVGVVPKKSDFTRPVVISDEGDGELFVWDGVHRIVSAIRLKVPTLPVAFGSKKNIPAMVESLNGEAAFIIMVDSPTTFETRTEINGKTFKFSAMRLRWRDDFLWKVVFFEVLDRTSEFGTTGKGDAFAVFNFVISSMSSFIEKYNPQYIGFSADSPNRASLYSKIVKRFENLYTVNVEHGGDVLFTLAKKPAVVSEVFDSASAVDRVNDTNGDFTVKTVINGKHFTFSAHDADPWEISFHEQEIKNGINMYSNFHATGKGDAFNVFSFVARCLQQFIKSRAPERFMFDAKPDRTNLYVKIVEKMAPEYSVSIERRWMGTVKYDHLVFSNIKTHEFHESIGEQRINWAIGDNVDKAESRYRQDGNVIVWVNIAKVMPLVDPMWRITPDSLENHIGSRMERAIEHITAGGWMDPPDISIDKHNKQYPIFFGNGRHRVAAAVKLGSKAFPASVSIEDATAMQRMGILMPK